MQCSLSHLGERSSKSGTKAAALGFRNTSRRNPACWVEDHVAWLHLASSIRGSTKSADELSYLLSHEREEQILAALVCQTVGSRSPIRSTALSLRPAECPR